MKSGNLWTQWFFNGWTSEVPIDVTIILCIILLDIQIGKICTKLPRTRYNQINLNSSLHDHQRWKIIVFFCKAGLAVVSGGGKSRLTDYIWQGGAASLSDSWSVSKVIKSIIWPKDAEKTLALWQLQTTWDAWSTAENCGWTCIFIGPMCLWGPIYGFESLTDWDTFVQT